MTEQIRKYVTCDVCGEWYETEPEQCTVCGEENEFTDYDQDPDI